MEINEELMELYMTEEEYQNNYEILSEDGLTSVTKEFEDLWSKYDIYVSIGGISSVKFSKNTGNIEILNDPYDLISET